MKILYCFCTDLPDSGNPAGVIFDFSGGKTEKQKLAQQRQLPVIVFIEQANSSIPILQFFYPNIEMNLCLHGALAAVFLLMKLDHQVVQIKVSAEPAPTYVPDLELLKQPLNLSDVGKISTDLPLTVASVGSPKLFIPLRSPEILATLHPNFDLIKQWSLDNKINGLYVYAPESTDPLLLQARAFNPKTGQNEDAATGVAAAALALIFRKNLIINQGHFIGKSSQLMVTYRKSEEIYVGGKIIEYKEPC
jgi:trans-2,3-dihydro-3-hydroxyanthranilate isomerase